MVPFWLMILFEVKVMSEPLAALIAPDWYRPLPPPAAEPVAVIVMSPPVDPELIVRAPA